MTVDRILTCDDLKILTCDDLKIRTNATPPIRRRKRLVRDWYVTKYSVREEFCPAGRNISDILGPA